MSLKKVHRVTRFNQKAWLKSYIDMNNELRNTAKNDFEKDFFKLMNNSAFGKTMENISKHKTCHNRRHKACHNRRKKNYLVSEPNYHTTKNLLAVEMKKTQIFMNKTICLDLSILERSKIVMYEFPYDYLKPKYNEKTKLCYMDTDSFILHVKTEDIYEGIGKDVEKMFDTSNYELERSLPRRKNKKSSV